MVALHAGEGEFEVVLESFQERDKAAVEKLCAMLSSRLHTQIVELDLHFPLLITKTSEHRVALALSKDIQALGGKVSISRGDTSSSPYYQAKEVQTLDLKAFFTDYTENLKRCIDQVDVTELETLVKALLTAREKNRQIFVFGNGGSAATASHIANDFSKPHFSDHESLFRIISLNDNMSQLMATANDYGYQYIFENQLKNLLQQDDVVLGISSSGNSENVVRAIEFANSVGAHTFALVGFDGGRLKSVALNTMYIPSKKGQYGFMEDITLMLNHVCAIYILEKDKEKAARLGK